METRLTGCLAHANNHAEGRGGCFELTHAVMEEVYHGAAMREYVPLTAGL